MTGKSRAGADRRPAPRVGSSEHRSRIEDARSPIVRGTVKQDADDDTNITRSASPSAGQNTRTGDVPSPSSRVTQPASPAVQLRDPDRYTIIGEHGRGGLGRVSRAHDRDLGRDVAIKELISRGHVNEIRFLREALITARLEHPSIVPVHEAGRWPDGTPFYSMKLVAGRPLRALIAERATVVERIGLLHHVIAVADAIAYAHGRNIIHRDLKPANVIVGDFGETIVIDWGLAKDLSAAQDSAHENGPFRANRGNTHDDLTDAGTILGTPSYMAPEQERGDPVDHRADVFAIGAMLWEICSLQRVPPTDVDLRHRLLRASNIDPDLATIIDKALAPIPAQRYPNADALAKDLKAFAAGGRIAARSYSLLALLTHWTRRHRRLATAIAVAALVSTIGVTLYVHNIASERGRADDARVVADRERRAASIERDRAQLSEAALLLEKDPTRAKALISRIADQSATYALMSGRASQRSALYQAVLPENVTALVRDEKSAQIGVSLSNGTLSTIDTDNGVFTQVGAHLTGPVVSINGEWLYARRLSASRNVDIASTRAAARSRPAAELLNDPTSKIVQAGNVLYGLDNTDMYVMNETGPSLLRSGVRSIAGSDRVLMTCDTLHVLNISRDGVALPPKRCAANVSRSPMVAFGNMFAALATPETLLLFRDERELELKTSIAGEYALALSSSGLLALADFEGRSWMVRPDRDTLEPGPRHTSQPSAVAADGTYAAWGYVDGSIVVIDVKTNETWEFKGHNAIVGSLVVDAKRRRLTSTAGVELRVWDVSSGILHRVVDLPCRVFNVARSVDGGHAVLDGSDGVARIWATGTDTVVISHRHAATAYGVAWLGERACSASFDGTVICTSFGRSEQVLTTKQSVRWIISSPDRKSLVIATSDGEIRLFDGLLHILYTHAARPYRMAFSADGTLLASGATDGSVIVYDMVDKRVISRLTGHTSTVSSIEWQNGDLWTASLDGTVRRWRRNLGDFRASQITRGEGAIRLFHLIGRGGVYSESEHFLVVTPDFSRSKTRIDLGRRIERVEISDDHRYLVATVANEAVVVDMVAPAIASLYIPSDGIGYVGFVGPNSINVSVPGGLRSADLSRLEYHPFKFAN